MLLDDRCKPWLLEVNHSPAFSIGGPLDAAVKEALLADTLLLVGSSSCYVHHWSCALAGHCCSDRGWAPWCAA